MSTHPKIFELPASDDAEKLKAVYLAIKDLDPDTIVVPPPYFNPSRYSGRTDRIMSQVDDFHFGSVDDYPAIGVPHPGPVGDCPLCTDVKWVAEPLTTYQVRCVKCRNHAGPPLKSSAAVRQWMYTRTKPCRYCEAEEAK